MGNAHFSKLTAVQVTVLLIIICSACTKKIDQRDYLTQVLDNLEGIRTATYFTKGEGWAPADTVASVIFYNYFKEFNNSSDSTIGASYIRFPASDTTKPNYCYDGNIRAIISNEEKSIIVDNFTIIRAPFRIVNPPFFNYAKSIIKYILESQDSILIYWEHSIDTVHISLTIFNDEQVEFFGKPYYIENPYSWGENNSKYEIWIDKQNNLPFRIRREMSHDISVLTCRDIKINKESKSGINATDYFPPNYSIQAYGLPVNIKEKSNLIGNLAPDWSLFDVNNTKIELNNLKSKVLMIQFTSVSCGPCRVSIPFLKQLSNEYKIEDFDFVAIESYNQNSRVLANYQKNNDFSYKFLISNKEITSKYQVIVTPTFYILDQNRIIRRVITGYNEITTDLEIRKAINELI